MGSGGFGGVSQYFDLITREKYAKKTFKNIDDYKEEKETYKKLESKFDNNDLKE